MHATMNNSPARCALTRRIEDERASGGSDSMRVRSGMDFWLKLNELAWCSVQRMLEHQFTATSDCLESAAQYLKALSEAKSLPEMWLAQTRLTNEFSGKWMARMSEALEATRQEHRAL